ncbi:MAG: hypothetical protein KF774_15415 [Planctomyces sp.]|nr:hypothetical protein [Planctomyces sp.]
MKIPGNIVFQELRRSLSDLHADAAALRTQHRELDARMQQVIAERGAAFLELARHYLPVLSREASDRTFGGIRDDLLAIVERKERRVRELAERLGRLQESAAASQARADASLAAADEATRNRDQRRQALVDQLARNEEFQTLSRQALESEQELQRDEERVVEIQREAAEKIPAYERSRLFRYLRDVGFGTADYRPRGLRRRMDRWVARQIEFSRASRSYDFLRHTPDIMRTETDRRRDEFHRTMERIEALETTAAGELAIEQSERAATAAAAERERLTLSAAADRDRVQALELELAALDQQQGQFYEDAVNRFRTFLAQTEMGLLESRALQTPDRVDDEIVGRLKSLTGELADLDPRVSELVERSQAAVSRCEGMEFIVRRFEQSNFHVAQSFFEPSFDTAGLVSQFRTGAFDRDAFWQLIRRSQERELTEFERRAAQAASDMLQHPLTGALAEAMARVAGATLSGTVGRSVQRRGPR